ncbi:hypothetical protein [Streptomyces sp. NPDC058434]|uniref:hypothetical protein n=1 Tax=Streptomyces sp. NPDC058434 TaxID=3346498 RepID=UPI00365DF4F1
MGLNEPSRRTADTRNTGTGTGGTGTSTGTGGTGTVRVDIGELVLDGFDRLDPERVAAAFRGELARLVRDRGVPLAAEGGRAFDTLTGLPPLPATSSARRLGQALARAVHEGLSGRGEPG